MTKIPDNATITNISTLQIHRLTQAQYDTAFAAGNLDDTAIYLTPDEGVEVGAGLPPVTEADNGQILKVVNGKWAVSTFEVYNGEVI